MRWNETGTVSKSIAVNHFREYKILTGDTEVGVN
jgi:hypothetical protein